MEHNWALFVMLLIQLLIDHADLSYCQLHAKNSMGLINHWPIEGNTKDYIGGADMMNFVNAELTTDRFGRENSALNLTDGYVQVPGGVYFSGEFTFMTWIRPKSFRDWVRVSNFGLYTESDLGFSYYSGNTKTPNFGFHNNGDHTIDFIYGLSLYEWTHIAITKSSSEFKAFINGNFINSLDNDFLPLNINRPSCYFGSSDGSDTSNADMDDIKIFNKALNDTQVQYHYSVNLIFPI